MKKLHFLYESKPRIMHICWNKVQASLGEISTRLNQVRPVAKINETRCRRIPHRLLWASLLCCCIAQAFAQLGPGSAAPKLEIKEWVKGQFAPESLDHGITIVEFWATWCGPCHDMIPHLTKIAQENKDIRVVGVSIFEDNDKQQVQEFVKFMGNKMDYSVGYSGNKDRMAKTWMSAAKQPAIPTSFIVKDGVIMWIGHPIDLDDPLKMIKKGTFDVKASRQRFQKNLETLEKNRKIFDDISRADKLFLSGKRSEAKALLDSVDESTGNKAMAQNMRFKWCAIESPTEWRIQATKRIEESQDQGSSLSSFINENATIVPSECKWLLEQIILKFPDNWYPYLNGARMALKLKEYDEGLAYAEKSRQAIFAFQKANPDVPKGNALDVIKELEEEITKAKGGFRP